MGKYGEDKKSELIELGFLFDNQRAKYGFDLVKVALVRYKEIYGNFLVKQKFLIPTGDAAAAAQWPEKTWGIKLGIISPHHTKQHFHEWMMIVFRRCKLEYFSTLFLHARTISFFSV